MSPDDPPVPLLATLAVPVPQRQDTTRTSPAVLITPIPTTGISYAPLGVSNAARRAGTNPGPRTVSVIDTAITLTVRPGPSVCGRLMAFTATVTAASPDCGTPTGTVRFSADGGPAIPVVLSDGVATLTTPLGAGAHTVTATYAGDACFTPAPPATVTIRIWRTGF